MPFSPNPSSPGPRLDVLFLGRQARTGARGDGGAERRQYDRRPMANRRDQIKLTPAERVKYIRAQLRAVREANAEGWLAWSAGNRYDLLFEILRRFKDEAST